MCSTERKSSSSAKIAFLNILAVNQMHSGVASGRVLNEDLY